MGHKVAYPEECNAIFKEIKKGKVKAKDVRDKFKDKHFSYNVERMIKLGILKRTHVIEGDKIWIQYETVGKTPKFDQGRRNYVTRKRGGTS